jgi:hypothetical protein
VAALRVRLHSAGTSTWAKHGRVPKHCMAPQTRSARRDVRFIWTQFRRQRWRWFTYPTVVRDARFEMGWYDGHPFQRQKKRRWAPPPLTAEAEQRLVRRNNMSLARFANRHDIVAVLCHGWLHGAPGGSVEPRDCLLVDCNGAVMPDIVMDVSADLVKLVHLCSQHNVKFTACVAIGMRWDADAVKMMRADLQLALSEPAADVQFDPRWTVQRLRCSSGVSWKCGK